MEKQMVSYDRVSSANQSLELQRTAAERYLNSNDIATDSVLFISDFDVSATKITMNERSGLNQLIKLIKTNKVSSLIVYKRDRLARNFYEYTELVKLFLNHNIDVIFTASNEVPFMRNLVFESFYGMLAQMEANSIKGRTDDARKQYPTNIFGYIRSKEKDKLNYVPHPEYSLDVQQLFEKIISINNIDEFFSLMLDPKPFKFEKKFKILTNAFYSAHFQKGDLFQKLDYVVPIIDLELFKNATNVLDQYLPEFHKAILNKPHLLYDLPFCKVCGQQMKYKVKNVLDSGYIFCSNKHKRIEISLLDYNAQISHTLHEELLKLGSKQLRKSVIDALKKEKIRIEKLNKKLHNQKIQLSLDLTSAFTNENIRFNKSISTIHHLSEQIDFNDNEIKGIEVLIHNINELITCLNNFKLHYSDEDFVKLAALLIEKVVIDHEYTTIHFFIANIDKEAS